MNTPKPTKAEVWKTVYRELIGNAIIPVEVSMHPDDISVSIELQANQFEDVAAALAAFGLPEGTAYLGDDGLPYLWNAGKDREFYVWGKYHHSWRDPESPLLPGWNVEIYCDVHTADFPLRIAHAINGEPEASTTQPTPAVEVLTGEITSPYGPCNGLTADIRDNTCTNFAAEYVVWVASVTALGTGEAFRVTEMRRLCTSCADQVPNPMERRPLTTTPGGYPVGRA